LDADQDSRHDQLPRGRWYLWAAAHRRGLAVVALFAPLLLAAAFQLGKYLGDIGGEKTKVHLLRVWPDFMDWPARDKSVIISLVITCRLEVWRETIPNNEILACLRTALADPDVRAPVGVEDMRQEFNRLARKAQPPR
jgi:hypothetical protein